MREKDILLNDLYWLTTLLEQCEDSDEERKLKDNIKYLNEQLKKAS